MRVREKGSIEYDENQTWLERRELEWNFRKCKYNKFTRHKVTANSWDVFFTTENTFKYL